MIESLESLSKQFTRLLWRLVVLPTLLLIMLATLFLWQTFRLRTAANWTRHSDQVLSQANSVQKLTIDLETGVRGFNLYGSKEFLEPFSLASKLLPDELSKLRNLVSDNISQLAKLEIIQKDLKTWTELTHRPASSIKNAILRKDQFDQLRRDFESFIHDEEMLKDRRSHEEVETNRQTTIFTAIIALVLSVLLAILLARIFQSLALQYQKSLEEQNNRLVALRKSREWFSTTLTNLGAQSLGTLASRH